MAHEIDAVAIVKILHVITMIERGGAENHLASLVQAQAKLGHEVTVAFLKGKPYWGDALVAAGINVIDLGLRFYGDLRPLWRLYRAIVKSEPDILHAHLPPAELYVRLAQILKSQRVPVIVSKHNDSPFIDSRGIDPGGNWALRGADGVIAISGAVKAYFSRPKVEKTPLGIHTIHYGIDPKPFAEVSRDAVERLRESWRATPSTLVFGTLSRLVPQKSLSTMLAGFKEFKQLSSRDARLVIVGAGAMLEDLKKQAVELGIAQDVIWAGFQEQTALYHCAFDVFVLTSIYEGLGLVLLEAMAASRPVIATKVSAIPEIVGTDGSGILIPPQDSAALAAAMAQLDDEAARQKMGQHGLARVKKSFSIDDMTTKTQHVYQIALTRNPYGMRDI